MHPVHVLLASKSLASHLCDGNSSLLVGKGISALTHHVLEPQRSVKSRQESCATSKGILSGAIVLVQSPSDFIRGWYLSHSQFATRTRHKHTTRPVGSVIKRGEMSQLSGKNRLSADISVAKVRSLLPRIITPFYQKSSTPLLST